MGRLKVPYPDDEAYKRVGKEKYQQISRSGTGSIMANPAQLHQIGMNLITNAYQAVQDKNGKIMVVLEEIDLDHYKLKSFAKHSGRYALLTVSDNGTGMTEEVKKKVFDPLYRLQ